MVYEGAGVTLVHTLPILVWIWTNAKVTNMKIQQGNDCFITLFQSLDYVKNYAEATSQWEGFPIRVGICPQHPFYHQHLGECASSKHLGGLQRIRFCRRHQHSCRGSRGAGSSWHHGVVLQVWYCRHQNINTPWSCTGLVLVLVWYCRHHYINTSWSGIAAFGMVFSTRRTGTAATGDLGLPKII